MPYTARPAGRARGRDVLADDHRGFESVASGIDLLPDYAGGDVLQRSCAVQAAGAAEAASPADTGLVVRTYQRARAHLDWRFFLTGR